MRAVVVATLGVTLVLLAGCTQVVTGRPSAAGPAPAPTAPAPAATGPGGIVTAALQEFWRHEFPASFGREWRDIAVFSPVATGDAAALVPPCVERAADLVGQAFYCPAADAVAWDADGLLPALDGAFGTAGVVVVLAHEVGHAVQTRLGVDEEQLRAPSQYPTILLEAMADCYAGVALAHFAENPGAGVPLGPDAPERALLALTGFRDPLGVVAGDQSAHGNGFDRVSAFLDGYVRSSSGPDGAARCAEMSVPNREFTQRRFGSAADQARGGDLPLAALLRAVEADARRWFADVAAPRAPGWVAPRLSVRDSGACPGLSAQGPVRFCAADGSVSLDQDELVAVHRDLGDYAVATLVAGRLALAAAAAAGDDPAGMPASVAAVCLAGAYTAQLLDPEGSFSLSPGDLDEAVQLLLSADWAARDAHGKVNGMTGGVERLLRFRAGLQSGFPACLGPA